ncbi:Uncharacterized oxidoreductase C663 [Seminavis robusta]|uniref:Uncharacterized oxidoreductase C663 n=1 Tax=Seminavis robusta TaxID=568900 RepID=A0A9N8DBC3_9STRA|nr:Uncharacterized oxidoreductase C663 [Seminavis robusta]|eukprot:Sro71_g039220.1 Uncharacterized oxidoreductase C663 (266) ;mRNA; f:10548-11345
MTVTNPMTTAAVTVVTGCNKGMGLEIVKQLLDRKEEIGKVFGLCRRSSPALDTLASNSDGKLVVLDNIDVSNDAVVKQLQDYFGQQPIDVVIHNAGASGLPKKFADDGEFFASQSLANITMENMRFTFELNTLGPLRVTQALLPNLKNAAASNRGHLTKVIIISSSGGSIASVESGGLYSYRTSKAAVNMVGKNIAEDLKPDGIALGLIHPGTVDTGMLKTRTSFHRDVDVSVKGVLKAADLVTLENTGSFVDANYGEGVKPLPW